MIYFIFCALVVELILGGGGRLFVLWGVPLRFIFFGIALFLLGVYVQKKRHLDSVFVESSFLVFLFLLTFAYGLLIAVINGNEFSLALNDVKISFLWFLFPLFAVLSKSSSWNYFVVNSFISGALFLAILQLFIVAGLFTGFIEFSGFYGWAYRTGEFFFRNEYFFVYKGHIFLVIGLIGCLTIRPKYYKSISLVILVAMLTTATRGFLLSTIFAFFIILFLGGAVGRIASMFLIFCSLAFGLSYINLFRSAQSDQTRIDDFSFILEHFDYTTLLGHGAGSLINGRVAIESVYFNLLYKFGVLGLFVWIVPLLLFIFYFVRVWNLYVSQRRVLKFGLASVMVIYFQSFFNPYLINSMGLLVVIFWLAYVMRGGKSESFSGACNI